MTLNAPQSRVAVCRANSVSIGQTTEREGGRELRLHEGQHEVLSVQGGPSDRTVLVVDCVGDGLE